MRNTIVVFVTKFLFSLAPSSTFQCKTHLEYKLAMATTLYTDLVGLVAVVVAVPTTDTPLPCPKTTLGHSFTALAITEPY